VLEAHPEPGQFVHGLLDVRDREIQYGVRRGDVAGLGIEKDLRTALDVQCQHAAAGRVGLLRDP
jgi:hypothetical protein